MMVLIDKEKLLYYIKETENLVALIQGGYTNSKVIEKAQEEYLNDEDTFPRKFHIKTIEDASNETYCNDIICGYIQEPEILGKTLEELIKEM